MSLIQIDSTQKQEGEVILKYMKNLIDSNRTFLCSVVAPVGKGKSWSCLRWGELWYSYYHGSKFPRENICFGAEQLLKRLNDESENKLKKGDLLILEEGGVNIGNKKFMSKINLAVNYVVQSFRSLNIILFINVPFVNFLDKSVRMLQTAIFEIEHVDKSKGQTYIKPYFIQVNQWSGKVYKKWLRLVDTRTHRKIKIKRVCISKPSLEIVNLYEPLKKIFVKDTIAEGLSNIQQENVNKFFRKKQLPELTPRQKQIYDLLCQGITSTGEIAKVLNIAQEKVSTNKGYIVRKGYFWGNQAMNNTGGGK